MTARSLFTSGLHAHLLSKVEQTHKKVAESSEHVVPVVQLVPIDC